MPDTKLSGLTKITSACSVDLVYLAHDPAGTIISAGISSSSLFQSIPGTTGLVIGSDTILYRSAASTLKTDGMFIAGTNIMAVNDFQLWTAGKKIQFGDSSGSYDVELYRSAANELFTDDSFTAYGHIRMYSNWSQLLFGNDAGVYDTNLYRVGSNTLKTDDSFECLTVRATGDEGGVASQVAITNVVNETISTGVGSLRMGGTTARTNTGWLKIYNGTSVRYIPYFTTITG